MSEATLNWVNSFTRFFEAAYNLRDIIRVSMTQTKLSITIIFSNSVNEALNTDKETKIEATAYSWYVYLFMERHLNWDTVFLSRFNKRPRKSQSVLSRCECKISSCGNWVYSQPLFAEEV